MTLRITGVKSGTVEGNYQWTFVKIESGDNYGIGEGFPAPQLEAIVREYSPLLLNEDALNINKILDKLRWAAVPSGSWGINCHAISAIEMAVLDLVGKHLNLPVYSLLGGKFRERVRLYVDVHAGKSLEAMSRILLPVVPKWINESGKKLSKNDRSEPLHGRRAPMKYTDEYSPEAYASRARQMRQEGYTAMKFDLDIATPYSDRNSQLSGRLSNKEINYLSELVSAVREAVGEETDIMFDLHWKYDVESCVRLARSIENYNVMWLEDPVPPENIQLLSNITRSISVPIASGENLYGRYQFCQLLDTGVSIVTPDAAKTGGLLETKFIAGLAGIREVTVSPHNISSPIGTMAQAHLSAAIPNFGVLEFHGHDVPIWDRLATRKIIRDGYIELRDDPGLGVELDLEVARKYSLNDRFDL